MSLRAEPAVLERARDLVTPALRSCVEGLHPEIRLVVSYHFGWADSSGNPAGGSGGKALRPALALLGAEATGAPAEAAIPGAVAVELVHNFSLLHDDVMDGDTERRHRPTAWSLYGVGPAIVAGDALLALAHQVLGEGDDPAFHEASGALAQATATMIAGQAQDLAFESRSGVSYEECLTMSARKTAALLECSASIGAILAGASGEIVVALRDFGHDLGVAFQAIDDTFGVWGTPERTGKPAHSDLRQHKRTLPIVAALQGVGEASRRLGTLLDRNGALTERDLQAAARLVDEAGGRERTLATARCRLESALASLDEAELAPQARAELVELAHFACSRDH